MASPVMRPLVPGVQGKGTPLIGAGCGSIMFPEYRTNDQLFPKGPHFSSFTFWRPYS